MHLHDFGHGLGLGKLDVVEEAAPEEGVRKLFLVVGSDDHDRAVPGLDGGAGLIDEEFHAVEFLQQIIGEFDVRLVDFVDQQHGVRFHLEGFPELAGLECSWRCRRRARPRAGNRASG